MRILLKKYNGEEYVWKNATYGQNGNFVVDGNRYNETSVISVANNNHHKYITCNHCGQTFKRNSAEWIEHKSPERSTKQCFSCGSLSISGFSATRKSTFTPQKDGTYKRTVTDSVGLACSQCWDKIDSKRAKEVCIYNPCVNAAACDIFNVFTKYGDDVFDDLITVDRILEHGYTDMERINDRETTYKLKSKYNITAYTNSLNIVTHFYVTCKGYGWNLMYSKKLNKLFDIGYAQYNEWSLLPYIDIKESTQQAILKTIASLYE